MTAQRLLAIVQSCSDLDAQVAWYRDHLGFQEQSRDLLEGPWISGLFGCSTELRIARSILRLGSEQLQLWQWHGGSGADSAAALMAPVPADSRSNDGWFQHICMVTHDLNGCYSGSLQRDSQPISSAVQTLPAWNEGAAGIKAVKFTDPLVTGWPLKVTAPETEASGFFIPSPQPAETKKRLAKRNERKRHMGEILGARTVRKGIGQSMLVVPPSATFAKLEKTAAVSP